MSNANMVSWVFASVALLYLAGIATYLTIRKTEDNLSPAAGFILGFFCAIAGGFCTYFFTGELGLNFQVPATNIEGNAAGGLATFVLVLLLWYLGITKPTVKVNERLADEKAAEAKRLADEKAAEAKRQADESAERAKRQAEVMKAVDVGLLGRLDVEGATAAKAPRKPLLGRQPPG